MSAHEASDIHALITALTHRLHPAVQASAARQLGMNEAPDATARVFEIVWKKRDSVPSGHEESARWVFAVLRNVVHQIRHELRADTNSTLDDIDHDRRSHLDDIAHDVADRAEAQLIYRSLNDRERHLLELQMNPLLTENERAAHLDLSPPSYRVRVHRLRMRITAITELLDLETQVH